MADAVAPALAAAIAGWFPELNGRSVAVSEAEVTRENVPTFPLVMVAFIRDMPKDAYRSNTIEMVDEFVVSYLYEPTKYKLENGAESPFWAFFDYEPLRRKLITHLKRWRSPVGGQWEYRGADVESTTTDVSISFRFVLHYLFCEDEEAEAASQGPVPISLTLLGDNETAVLSVSTQE
jgi:hypothetical protein